MAIGEESDIQAKLDTVLKISEEMNRRLGGIAERIGGYLKEVPWDIFVTEIGAEYENFLRLCKSWDNSRKEFIDRLTQALSNREIEYADIDKNLNRIIDANNQLSGSLSFLFLILYQWAVARGEFDKAEEFQKEYERTMKELEESQKGRVDYVA